MDAITQRDPDSYPEEIRPIIRILLTHEEALSDGYGYYCEVHETLERIARKILTAVKESTEKERHA